MRNVDTKAFKKAMIDADCDTYGELSERTGINRSALSDYASGKQRPSYDSVEKLAEALCLSYEEIGRIFYALPIAELKEN